MTLLLRDQPEAVLKQAIQTEFLFLFFVEKPARMFVNPGGGQGDEDT